MKKLLLINFLFIGTMLMGQAISNGTFENWTSTPYNDPTGWTTGNLRDLQRLGTPSVTEVTGYSGHAVRIQTNIVGVDTSDSYIVNTSNPCSSPTQWVGGVPYTQLPTAITGYYRYSLAGNDTAILIVIFRKNGVHVGDNFIKIRGTGSVSSFTSFSFPLTCSTTPDSMIIASSCSNKISNIGVANGSFLELDNLAFTGTTQSIPNGTFDNWTSKSNDVLSGWGQWGSEGGVVKTTSAHGGSYAVRLETMFQQCNGGSNSSGITTGTMSNNNGPQGGRPYTLTSDTLCGYYKYTSMGGDSANIIINLTRLHVNVGGAGKMLPAVSGYTYFEIPIGAMSNPDTMRIDIQSSKWPTTTANIGSILFIDDLYLKSNPLHVAQISNQPLHVSSYPNPVRNLLTLQFNKAINHNATVNFYDITGREITAIALTIGSSVIQADISTLPAGMYFYQINCSEGIVLNKFIKQ